MPVFTRPTAVHELDDSRRRDFRITRALKLTPEVRRRARELAQQMGIGDKFAAELMLIILMSAAVCAALLWLVKANSSSLVRALILSH